MKRFNGVHRLDIDPRVSALDVLVQLTPELLDGGREAADSLDGSWRHFNVGVGSLAKDDHGYLAIFGANYKRHGGQPMCAEQLVVHRAVKAGARLLSFQIDAPVQPDTHSGHHFPTTHPCGRCREGSHTLQHPNVSKRAVVVTRETGTSGHQVFSVPELRMVHDTPAESPEIADSVIDDPDYFNLRFKAPDILSDFTGQSAGEPSLYPDISNLPMASSFRTIWLASLACNSA